jgi:hypothetical protein
MRLLSAALLLTFAALPARGGEVLDFQCDGAFGADTSHERLVEVFGATNVVFDQVAGPEGTYPKASVIFPNEPEKRLSVYWQDDDKRQNPYAIFIGGDSLWTVQGLRVGMKVEEVDKLNGRPFSIGGFNDVTHGTVEHWLSGKVNPSIGVCYMDVEFGYPHLGVPLSLDDGLESDGPHSSQDPILQALGAKVQSIVISYPWPQ